MAGLNFATLSGDYAVISEAEVEDFRVSLHGESLLPGDEDYDSVRRIWNAMVDKQPALIARCSGAADVINSVNFARENGLLISVRGGGHNFPGNSVCDDGLMIDLSRMTGVRVDPVAKTVRAQGGTKWGAFDHETQAFGLAAPGGTDPDTGIAGLTLGGGIGWLSGSYGLSCDNVVFRRRGHRRRAGRSPSAPTRTPTCSGASGAAAATLASSPLSSTGCIPSALRSWRATWSTRTTR